MAESTSPRSEWPAELAAHAVRAAFLIELFRSWTPDQFHPGLACFYKALLNPIARARTALWIETFAREWARAAFEEMLSWPESHAYADARFWAAHPDLPPDPGKRAALRRLFEELLGIAIMRPIEGSPGQTAVYYAAIDSPCLTESSKRMIRESVLVPARVGSVGQCLERGQYCVGNSFGDYAGTVEWQDLLQGQISIAMVSDTARVQGDTKTLYFCIQAFLPIPYVFGRATPPPYVEDMEPLERASEVFAGPLRACLEDDTFRNCIGALIVSQEKVRQDQQFQEALAGTAPPEQAILDLIVPDRAADVPAPLAGAATLRAEGASFAIDHLRLTAAGLEAAMLKRLDKPCDPARIRSDAAELVEAFFGCGIQDDALLFLPSPDHCETVWAVLRRDGLGWPAASVEPAGLIHRCLHTVLSIAERIVTTVGPELARTGWGHGLSLLAELKLRDHFAQAYYGLVQSAFTANDIELNERMRTLGFLVRTCCAFGGSPDHDSKQANELWRDAEVAIRIVREALGKDLLCGTWWVRKRHVLSFKKDSPSREQQWLTQLALLQRSLTGSSARIRAAELIVDVPNPDSATVYDGAKESRYTVEIAGRFTAGTRLEPDGVRCCVQHLQRRIGAHADIEELRRHLHNVTGFGFEFLENDASDAARDILIALPWDHRSEPALKAYRDKLAPLGRLHRVLSEKATQTSAVERERGRAEAAEQLVSGTCHTLKIPIHVALQHARKGQADQAAFVLERCMPIVQVGAYIQSRWRSGKSQLDCWWEPAAASTHKCALILDEEKLRAYVQVALEYADAKSGGSDVIATRLRTQPGRCEIAGCGTPLVLMSGIGDQFETESMRAGVFQALMLELLANAITHGDRSDPQLRVSLVHNPPSDQLVIAVTNSVSGQHPWRDENELRAWMARQGGIVGLQTAAWILEAFGWKLRCVTADRLLTIRIEAPVRRRTDVVDFVGRR